MLLQQIRRVGTTYVTHHWVMSGIAAWMLLVFAPQIVAGAWSGKSPQNLVPMINTIVGMPLLFLSIMLVPQAKAQFANPRATLMPGFARPHILVLAGILLLMAAFFPLTVAVCLQFDALGLAALAAAIAATAIWAAHFSRMSGMVVTLAVFYSSMTSAGADWWLLKAEQHRPLHTVVLLTSLAMIAFWLARLCQLREEMDDYQTTVLWRMARKSGTEVSEQRRIIAAQLRRNKLASWISDAWLARVGGYHGHDRYRLVRLLRFGFAQPVEVQGLFLAVWFLAITLFLAKFTITTRGSGFGPIPLYLQMASIFPGMFAGEWLAQRRPRIATELMLPLSRASLITGLFAATAWNAAALWLILNFGLVFLAWIILGDQFTVGTVVMMLFLSASATSLLAVLSMRTAVWPSMIRRLGALMVFMIVLQAPVVVWSITREKIANVVFVLIAVLMIAVGWLFLRYARRAWLNLELG